MEPKILSLNDTRQRVGKPSRTTLWRMVRDGVFPKPRSIGTGRKIGFLESEVTAWIESRPVSTAYRGTESATIAKTD